jgi:hypothetical protein
MTRLEFVMMYPRPVSVSLKHFIVGMNEFRGCPTDKDNE